MCEYISSIICQFGDERNVVKDVKILNEIMRRQGTSLFLHVIAESIGETAFKFKMTQDEIMRVKNSVITELKNLIDERT